MYKIKTYRKKILADTLTPVSIYQKIRDKYSNSVLLESSDYGANDNSYAYVCFNPIAHISIHGKFISKAFPCGKKENTEIFFDINFEIENRFLNIIMEKSFQFGLNKIADSFQKRANHLFKGK